MAQTAGTLCIRSLPGQTKPTLVYFLTIDKAKFRKPVIPGDVLEYHMTRSRTAGVSFAAVSVPPGRCGSNWSIAASRSLSELERM